MITFQSNEKNDLQVDKAGNLTLISGVPAVGQTARQYMQVRQGEMFLAVPDGIPYESVLWSGSPNLAQFEAAARARLLQVPDVLEVVAFESRLVDGVLRYTATIRTDSAEVVVNG